MVEQELNLIARAKAEIEKNNYKDQDIAKVANMFYYVSSGYIADGYHLEFPCDSHEEARGLAEILAAYEMLPKLIERKGKVVVYLKSGECMCNLLALIGARVALLELHNKIALRGARNLANRRANFDIANLTKQANSASRQVEAAKRLVESGDVDKLSPRLQETVHARIKYKEASLEELANILDVSKSGLVNRLKKIFSMGKI